MDCQQVQDEIESPSLFVRDVVIDARVAGHAVLRIL